MKFKRSGRSISALVKILLLFFMGACSVFGEEDKAGRTEEQKDMQEAPLNIILMIGDGMGLPQITTAFYYQSSPSNFERFRNIGFIKTSSKSHKVTDSAGGATAFATGEKSYNRAISVSTDTMPMPTILELLEKNNYKTGLVSLTSITHATPACFYAHVKDRDMEEDIAAHLVKSGVDFFAGGGLGFFTKRKDGKNLYTRLQESGYEMDSTQLSQGLDPAKRYGFLLADKGIPNKLEGRGDFLAEASQLALDQLSKSENGFFLMVEGSYIDWGGHARNGELVVEEVLDFDKTMGVFLDYVEQHENTLLIVTADHETGGMAVGKSNKADSVAVYFTTDQHTAELIPVFAKGKGAEDFTGIYENNEIYHKMLNLIKPKTNL